jgi:hypothetical protein
MLFHTSLIILHRPPWQIVRSNNVLVDDDIQICYESLEMIIKLLKTYSRLHSFSNLPLDFVYILSAATSTVLLRRFLDQASFKSEQISKPLSLLLGIMDEIKDNWPCVRGVRDDVLRHINNDDEKTSSPLTEETSEDFGLISDTGAADNAWNLFMGDPNLGTIGAFSRDIGMLDANQWFQS